MLGQDGGDGANFSRRGMMKALLHHYPAVMAHLLEVDRLLWEESQTPPCDDSDNGNERIHTSKEIKQYMI